MNSLGISKLINNNEISNASISLTDISTSKIENESLFFKNVISMIGQNNYNGPIISTNQKKQLLSKQRNIQTESKSNIDDNQNTIEDQIDKLMIGDISNMSDISDNNNSKGDITLTTIFGNKNSNEINNNIKNINKIIKNNENNNNNIKNKNNNNEEFKEFGEKEIDGFFR